MIFLLVGVLLVLSACSSGESTITTQSGNKGGVPIPTVISAALPTDGTLSAYIQVDGGQRQAMTIADGMASITLSGLTLGQHTFTMEFEFVLDSNPDQPLTLASANQTMNVVAGENPPLTFNNYDTESFDADGDGISNLAELSNNTNPFAGVVVSPVSGNTSEDGTTATFTVVLSSQPTADVVIGISSSDTTEGTINLDTITFNTTNWDTPQSVTITGMNDSNDDGDQSYTIILATATSEDPEYNGIDPVDVSLINLDYNFPPSVSNVNIIDGNGDSAVVGDTLTGSYDFSDADSDPEEGSTYRWLRNGTAIAGATSQTYTVTLEDSGQAISFEVTPLTATGTTPGSPAASADVVIDNVPVATDVKITASAPLITGTVLTGNYTYSDANTDTEGDSIFYWLRDDLPIVGATSPTYTLTDADIGKKIRFKVVPIALTGSIRGVPAISPAAINVNRIGETGGGLPRATAIKGNYAYVAASGILSIIDISDPTNPSQVGYYDTPGYAQNVAIVENYAFVVIDTGTLLILDISIPTVPTKVAALESMGNPRNIKISGNFAFIANVTDLWIVDISDPIAPTEAEVVDTAGFAYDVAISGKYAYVADLDYGLRIFDVSYPFPPRLTAQTEVASFQIVPETPDSVAISGNFAFLACGVRVSIIDFSDLANLRLAGTIEITAVDSWFNDVVIDGSYLYVLDSGVTQKVNIYDISNPEVPVKRGEFEAPENLDSESITIDGNYAYMVDRDYGMRIIDISDADAPEEIGAAKTTGYSYNIVVNGNYAYMAKNKYGLGIFDVRDPTKPIQVGSLNTPGHAYGVDVQGDFAYVADEESGLRVINISDPTAPSQKGAAITSGFAFDVAVSGDYAFVAGDDAGLIVVDVGQPDFPGEVLALDTPGLAQAVTINGNHVFLADDSGGLRIIDVSTPDSPTETGYLDTISALDVAVSGNYAYVAGGYGLFVVDITDLQSPQQIGSLTSTPGVAGSVTINGNYVYIADDVKGVIVFDVSVPDAPVEVGVFHTAGEAFGVAMSGNYAYVADNGFGLGIYEYIAP